MKKQQDSFEAPRGTEVKTAVMRTFTNEMFGALRVVILENGKPAFCLADVCRALTLANVARTKQRLAEGGITTVNTPTLNPYGSLVVQPMTYIDEANLCRCIFQSRKAEAERFQNWVFEEVLPQIRRTGGFVRVYDAQGHPLTDDELAAHGLALMGVRIAEANACNADCVTTAQVAHDHGLLASDFNALLRNRGIICRRQRRWQICEEMEGLGLTEDRVYVGFTLDGELRTRRYMTWTPEGVKYLNRIATQAP